MGEVKVLVVGDVTASHFFHRMIPRITALCPYCGERTYVTRVEENIIDIPRELMERVGYPTVGECAICGEKMVVGFQI